MRFNFHLDPWKKSGNLWKYSFEKRRIRFRYVYVCLVQPKHLDANTVGSIAGRIDRLIGWMGTLWSLAGLVVEQKDGKEGLVVSVSSSKSLSSLISLKSMRFGNHMVNV